MQEPVRGAVPVVQVPAEGAKGGGEHQVGAGAGGVHLLDQGGGQRLDDAPEPPHEPQRAAPQPPPPLLALHHRHRIHTQRRESHLEPCIAGRNDVPGAVTGEPGVPTGRDQRDRVAARGQLTGERRARLHVPSGPEPQDGHLHVPAPGRHGLTAGSPG
ncbi:hypothetical protein GCM10020220_014010 [Nonomuraea rubra]